MTIPIREPQAKYEGGFLWRRYFGELQWIHMSLAEAEGLAANMETCARSEHSMFSEERAHYAQFAADIRTAIEDYERGEK